MLLYCTLIKQLNAAVLSRVPCTLISTKVVLIRFVLEVRGSMLMHRALIGGLLPNSAKLQRLNLLIELPCLLTIFIWLNVFNQRRLNDDTWLC